MIKTDLSSLVLLGLFSREQPPISILLKLYHSVSFLKLENLQVITVPFNKHKKIFT